MKNHLFRFERTLILIIFPIMCLLILLMTISRITMLYTEYFTWAEEAARYLMIWMAFLAAMAGAKTNSHFRMTTIYNMVSPGTGKVIQTVANLFSLGIMAIIIYYGYHLITRQMRSGQLSPIMMIPMWIPYLAIPAGFVGMFVHTLVREYRLLKAASAPRQKEGAPE